MEYTVQDVFNKFGDKYTSMYNLSQVVHKHLEILQLQI